MLGKILWSTTLGRVGVVGINKRSLNAFLDILELTFEELLSYKKYVWFVKLEGIRKSLPSIFFKKFQAFVFRHKIKFIGLNIVQKICHGGCRLLK